MARGYTSRSQVHQQALQPLPTHSSGSSLFSVSSSPGPARQDPAQMRQRILLRYSWLGWSFGRGSWPGQPTAHAQPCVCPRWHLPGLWLPWLLLLPEVPDPACLAATLLPAQPHDGQATPAAPTWEHQAVKSKFTEFWALIYSLWLTEGGIQPQKYPFLGIPQRYFPLSSKKTPLHYCLRNKWKKKKSNACRLIDQDTFHKRKKISSW